MTQTTLEILKAGLDHLENTVKARRNDILHRIEKREVVLTEEEAWLDNEGNLIDEERVVELLDDASDYERGLEQLDLHQKTIVRKLEELGRGVKKSVGNKRKRPENRKIVLHAEKQKAAPVFTKKENATLKQKVEILDWHHAQGKKFKQGKTAEHWNTFYPNLCLKQPLISAWLKDETRIRQMYEDEQALGRAGNIKRQKQTEQPEVNEMLELWITKAMSDGIELNGEILRRKWHRFADLKGVPMDERPKLSDGWLASLKKRCGLRNYKRHGEAASASLEDVEKETQRLRDLIKRHDYQLKDIFNMDETGLFWAMAPDRGLMDKQMSGIKGIKKRLTYTFTINASGTEKLPPLVIGKARQPRAFQRKTGAQLGFYYRNNAKAWMTTLIYHEWIRDWDKKLQREGRHILLLQDNFSAHVPPDDITNIHVENFEPNLTAHVQPADAGIIRCFKAHYRAAFMNRAIDRYDSGITPAKIYDIDILEAMRIADIAWKEVDTTTIRNCWYKTGILPDSLLNPTSDPLATPAIPISSLINANPVATALANAEQEVINSLSHLERIGVLHPQNRLTLDDLLNPIDERMMYNDGTEKEICQAVLERHKAEEDNDGDVDGDESLTTKSKDKPARQDALRAVSTLKEYIGDMDEPFARELEALLAKFGRQTRLDGFQSLQPTSITDYFAPKSF